LNHADILLMEKHSTVAFRALNRETRLEQFQLADSLSGNTQKILILATQTSSFAETLLERRNSSLAGEV
jgi:hypothetical protein